MISAHQNAFDFQDTTSTVVSLKPLRSVGRKSRRRDQKLNSPPLSSV